jgi:two-component system chemotaxis sensor kinase CheA
MRTFQIELEEHLSTLNKGLLALEEGPSQEGWKPLTAALFRAAHSIKGTARALDLWDIEMIAHRLEDVLRAVQKGEVSLTPEFFDVLFPAVDALRETMAARLRGESLPSQWRNQLLAKLDAALRGDTETRGQRDTEIGEEDELRTREEVEIRRREDAEGEGEEEASVSPPHRVTESLPESEPEPTLAPLVSPPPQAAAAEETIRVATAKLDALMDGMGELLVARMRTEQRLTELREIQQRLVRWQKNWRRIRWHYRLLQQQEGPFTSTGLSTSGEPFDKPSW